jgi:ornithine carbamoyltransferase
MKRDFLSIRDFSEAEVRESIDLAIKLKKNGVPSFFDGDLPRPLDGKSAALIFKKPSLRTRVSFEVGVRDFGGHPVYITDASIGLGSREAVSDAASVLARYVGIIIMRTFEHKEIEEIGKYADVPVINALTDLLHPCQIMADAMTVVEAFGKIDGKKIAFVGDGANNIANSWINLASLLPFELRIGTVADRLPDADILAYAQKNGAGKVIVTHDPIEAVSGADVVYTDVWASMGEKDKVEERVRLLKPFQVNDELMSHTAPDSIFLHCLPAERGREVTDSVIDSAKSKVFDEAENRLHIQKAIMHKLLS